MLRLYDFIVGRPKVTLGFVLLVTLGFAAGLPRLTIRNNQDSDLPAEDEIVRTDRRIKDVFGDKHSIMIGIENRPSIYNTVTLQKIRDLSERLKSIPDVLGDEITSLATFKNLKSRDWGLERSPFIRKIPDTPEEMGQLRSDIELNAAIFGKLVSKNGDFTVVLANVKPGYDQGRLSAEVFKLVERFRGPERIYVAGTGVQAEEIDSGIQKDVRLLMPAALILVMICFYLSLRTVRGVVLPFLVVVGGIVWTMGLMGWLGIPITVVSSSLPALMVAVASSYGIHVVLHYYEQVARTHERKSAVRATLASVAPAVVMTGGTTALGAISLLLFRVVSIQEFGVAMSAGVIASTILTLTVIPAILALMKERTGKPSKALDDGLAVALASLARFSAANRVKVLVLATAATVAIGYHGLSRVQVGNDFVKYFAADHRLRIAFEKFNEKLGGARYLDIMIEGSAPEALESPALLKKIYELQKFVDAQPNVGYSASYADTVAQINYAMNGEVSTERRIPDTQEAIAQYLLLSSMSGRPGEQDALLDYEHQRAKMRIMLTSSEQADHRQLYNTIRSWVAQNMPSDLRLEYGGDVMFWLAQVRYIVEGKIQNVASSAIMVLVFCAIAFRSVTAGALSIVPLSFSAVLTIAFMSFLGIRLDLATAMMTSIGAGISIDFAIHYLKRFMAEVRSGRDMYSALMFTARTTGRAIVFDAASNVTSFSVFILSGFRPIQYFGWLINLMMITSVIATLVLFPALFSLVSTRFVRYASSSAGPRCGDGGNTETAAA